MKYIKQGSITELENDVFRAKGILYANDLPKVLWCEQPEAGTDFTIKYNEETGETTAFEATLHFTFGSVESHTKDKADAVVGDICYYGETPIGVVVIKGDETVKIISLFDLNRYGENSSNRPLDVWMNFDYSNPCSLYSTEGTKQGDWFWPTKNDLDEMNYETNKTIIQTSLESLNTLAITLDGEGKDEEGYSYFLWSSSPDGSQWAFCLSLGNYNYVGGKNKYFSKGYVRAFCEL